MIAKFVRCPRDDLEFAINVGSNGISISLKILNIVTFSILRLLSSCGQFSCFVMAVTLE